MPIFICDFDFVAESETELNLRAGDKVTVLSQDTEWWYGELMTFNGQPTDKKGWFVPSYGHIAVSLSPYLDLEPKQMLTKRKQTILTTLSDEKDFVKTLSSFINLIVEPILLLDTPLKRSIMGDPSLGLTLQLIKDIYDACHSFLDGIQKSASAIVMADCYSQFAPSLQLFAQYTSENTKALNALKSYNKQLDQVMAAQPLPDGITMEYCLLLPVNHYTKYAPALQEFLWLTPQSASELPALEAALLILTEQSNLVDEKNREEEEGKQLVTLQYLFQGNPQIFKPGRKIIREGELEKIRKDKSGQRFSSKSYYAHLFNDCLMYSVRYSMTGMSTLSLVLVQP
jgi:hypothetical protein